MDEVYFSERRAHPRYAIDVAATIVVVNQGTSYSARLFDLSLDGCGLRTGERLRWGTPVPVEIAFKINGISFRLAGVLERASDEKSAGVSFSAMAPRRRGALVEVLAELEIESAVAAEKECSSAPNEEASAALPEKLLDPRESATRTAPVPEKTGVPVKTPPVRVGTTTTAARAPISSVAAIKAAPPVELPPTSSPRPAPPEAPQATTERVVPKGRERRAQLRHAVDTRATILFIDVAARQEGGILDLSMSGCRIRTDARFPVGIYRRVEVEFRLDGLAFRLGGVVQSLHDGHTVGIRFLDLSERKRTQLHELMEEIGALQAQMAALASRPEEPPGKGQPLGTS